MTESHSAPALVATINRCERALRTAFPQLRWLFFEPDTEKALVSFSFISFGPY